ncbi:MAG: polyprenyl synthetase family protein [Legionellales bacterium]|nr:polyprenyl synthetase family protein [Legionellales bacterium]
MDLAAIRATIADDLQHVDNVILEALSSKVELIGQIGHHIVDSGGKRLRPMLVLLAARALDYAGSKHIQLAAIIEFIHTATLLHDDVVDNSLKRRSQNTANAIWGNSASVLVGDFVYSRSFQMMVEIERLDIMKILADATNRIAEGEVLQLLNRHNPATTEDAYMEVINYKTATLFQAATKLGATIANQSPDRCQLLCDVGLHLGIAYQLIDDLLDYSDHDIGKNIGDDLAEGKITLPLIHALQVGNSNQINHIQQAIKQGNIDDLTLIKTILHETKALIYTQQKAQEFCGQALSLLTQLPDSIYRRALMGVAEFILARGY